MISHPHLKKKGEKQIKGEGSFAILEGTTAHRGLLLSPGREGQVLSSRPLKFKIAVLLS